MNFSNIICNNCYQCPRHISCNSGGSIVCKNCSRPPHFHTISSSPFPPNINNLCNNNIASNQPIVPSSQNAYMPNYDQMTPCYPLVNTNVEPQISNQTNPACNPMSINPSSPPGGNLNVPNIFHNTSTSPPFQNSNSSQNENLTSPHPPRIINLCDHIPPSMPMEPNLDHFSTPIKESNNPNSESSLNLSKSIDKSNNSNMSPDDVKKNQ